LNRSLAVSIDVFSSVSICGSASVLGISSRAAASTGSSAERSRARSPRLMTRDACSVASAWFASACPSL
jgi:hypothetical protein